eukprot:scaffold1213_cov350-Prasinococcus_capsulatus_cf.AAC.3
MPAVMERNPGQQCDSSKRLSHCRMIPAREAGMRSAPSACRPCSYRRSSLPACLQLCCRATAPQAAG